MKSTLNNPLFLFVILFTCIYTLPVIGQETSLLDENGNPPGFKTLEIGAPAPDFDLPGIDGRNYTLADFSQADVLMVLFTSNHCPTSHAMEQRLQKLIDDYSDRSFDIVAINPNHPDGLRVDELGYGEFNDSFENETNSEKKRSFWDLLKNK